MQPIVQIWGRANSVNVQKVLWCCDEVGLPFERIDAGLQFGCVDTPEYRRLNPNGRVPTMVDGDFVLWESNAIVRYLVLKQAGSYPGVDSLYPAPPESRARIERWLDWSLGTLQPVERVLFQGMVRTRPEDRDLDAIRAAATATGIAWRIVDEHLMHGERFLEGNDFTLADLVLGAYARRWFGVSVEDRPDLKRLDRWYLNVTGRRGFKRYIAQPLT